MSHKIFLLGGRTGGPLTPLLAIQNNLTNANLLIIGIRKGIETKFAQNLGIPISYLPETKLGLFSHSNSSLNERVIQYWQAFLQVFVLIYAILLSGWYILRFKPAMILSAGSFLTVPVFLAAFVLKKLGLANPFLVLHQQDPQPGLASRFGIRFADIKTCVFEDTLKYSNFEKAQIIPNPIDTKPFEPNNLQRLKQNFPELTEFFRLSNKPRLLVFGGGSGAKIINQWVISNLSIITKHFRVLHLSGELRSEQIEVQKNPDYLHYKALFEAMPLALTESDLVLCRSGLGSITELLYLHKPAYLVPMKHSHQEMNAAAVKNYFYILDQDEVNQWVKQISTSYPQFFNHISYPDSKQTAEQLKTYYKKISSLLDKTT
jgi:UDP-N-acetylglucosamine--N-acetylmuramyl-(pentapeptide) pyrophosphoryl-undecaprenol N-acetylglucosamine transferase